VTSRGVTLVELVIVLAIMGVVASIAATLVGRIASTQQLQQGQQNLAQSVDGALAQVQDALSQALPNSVRVSTNAAGVWVEWIPVRDAGVARLSADSTGAPSDPLDTENASDNSFDVVGVPVATPPGAAWLVWQNLGTPEADAYAGTNRRGGVAVTAGGQHLTFTAGSALPPGNGSGRFFIVDTPQTLACRSVAGGGFELRRYSGYGWQAAQPVADAALASASVATLASGLESCQAAYGSALANIGLVTLRLVAADARGARLPLVLQVALDNTP
jgi:prepilin-type N-terminal cleavage/methylation domain-containing protein